VSSPKSICAAVGLGSVVDQLTMPTVPILLLSEYDAENVQAPVPTFVTVVIVAASGRAPPPPSAPPAWLLDPQPKPAPEVEITSRKAIPAWRIKKSIRSLRRRERPDFTAV